MTEIKDIKQEDGSYDCGYLAGYAASLYFKSSTRNPFGKQMTLEDAYAARNKFMPRNDGLVARGFPGLNSASGMLGYLTSLGCSGYSSSGINPNPEIIHGSTTNPEHIRAALFRYLSPHPGRHVLLMSIRSLRLAHWVLILGNPKTDIMFVYDPGGDEGHPYLYRTNQAKLVPALVKTQVHAAVFGYEDKPAPGAPPQPGGRTHKVVAGESLSAIAGKLWNGDVLLWPLIWDVNKDAVPFPSQIRIGEELIIPDISKLSESEKIKVRQRGRTGG